jgi:hypothetical protein
MTTLASLQDFAAFRGVDPADPTDYRAILALESASDVVRKYTGQSFDLVEDDEATLDGTGTPSLVLEQLPVVEVSEVTTYDASGENETVLEPADWALRSSGILIRRKSYEYWPRGKANILVTYTHGYDLSDPVALPADLRLAVMSIASRAYSTGATTAGEVTQESIGSYRVTYATGSGQVGVLDSEATVLDLWRLPRVA